MKKPFQQPLKKDACAKDKGKAAIRSELALRNRLIRKYPLDQYPLPGGPGDEHAADVLANMAAMGK